MAPPGSIAVKYLFPVLIKYDAPDRSAYSAFLYQFSDEISNTQTDRIATNTAHHSLFLRFSHSNSVYLPAAHATKKGQTLLTVFTVSDERHSSTTEWK